MEKLRYEKYQKEAQIKHEALCARCGACCGSKDGDPCIYLKQEPSGKYHCDIYEARFGPHKTISGDDFVCVPIREVFRDNWPGKSMCVYVKVNRKS